MDGILKEAFARAGIVMPEPIRQARVQRLAAVRPAAAPATRTPVPAADLSVETHLDGQIDQERAGTPGDDLLNAAAPRE